MTGRRWTSMAIAGTLALAVAGSGLTWFFKGRGGGGNPPAPATAEAARSPLKTLAEGIRGGDGRALVALCDRVTQAEKQAGPISEAEAGDLIAVLDGLRAGFSRFDVVGRASAIAAASHILDRFKAEPAPREWFDALRPIHSLILAGLADPGVDVRAAALTEVGRHWNWLPGRAMTPAEETTLAEWKDAFYEPAKRCLGDREPKTRAAAVVCLGSASIDSMAAPAAAYVEDPDSGGVRYKTLMIFANRPSLLTEDAVIKRLHDHETGIPELAELILKGRGLSKDQIFLGRQMYNPRPEVRSSVIPLLRERSDIDPEVWLLQLSRDADEHVRAKAVEALADLESPRVDQRLREMASSDTSATVRAAAGKHVAKAVHQTTAALPPLPGSPSLNPRAN